MSTTMVPPPPKKTNRIGLEVFGCHLWISTKKLFPINQDPFYILAIGLDISFLIDLHAGQLFQ